MNEKDMIYYLLDLLSPEDKETFENAIAQDKTSQKTLQGLENSLGDLQASWLKKQARVWVQADQLRQARLQRIVDSILDEADHETRSMEQKDIEAEPHMRTFYEDLKVLATHIEEIDKPSYKIKDLIAGTKSSISRQAPQLAWMIRGAEKFSLDLSILPEYGFQIKLFTAKSESQEHIIEGAILPLENETGKLLENIANAQVWLLPSSGYTWYQDKVNAEGKFNFSNVPSGKYTFEMAWPNAFLEVFDVNIPGQ